MNVATKLIGHEYFALLWGGLTVRQIARDRGISHVAIINGLKRAGRPSATEIQRLRMDALDELLLSAVAAEQSLRFHGATLHADRLQSALKPFHSTVARAA